MKLWVEEISGDVGKCEFLDLFFKVLFVCVYVCKML